MVGKYKVITLFGSTRFKEAFIGEYLEKKVFGTEKKVKIINVGN